MDVVDRVTEQWAQEKPELKTEPMAIMGRILRIAKHMENEVAKLHKRYGLKFGEFDVLATLRRSGEPFSLTPSALMGSMLLTSGAMTNRLDKLESKGLIARTHSKEDRRSVSVKLTQEGTKLIDEMMQVHVDLQHSLIKGMSPKQKTELNQYLKVCLAEFE
ncbi:MarR family winged helix-turn-helix transcriptional regulator [Vibrio japonicus]|uniref:MarR family transcriptional regulator n=1 Tax=Vibrio japonicus TaxID=1824638 RepID=A0ABY5LKI3_9VIBR|nr:MarR family transcriptional regulator [Vibrio japonicus]UUM31931.1 MarR family transcriptional regulator [Vibrio japonicus]